jgi:hypothetical protein
MGRRCALVARAEEGNLVHRQSIGNKTTGQSGWTKVAVQRHAELADRHEAAHEVATEAQSVSRASRLAGWLATYLLLVGTYLGTLVLSARGRF